MKPEELSRKRITMESKLMIVTPEMAQRWLSVESKNRHVSNSRVDQLRRDIVDGKWVANGDTIKIGDYGEVIDGQHRLRAVIASGIAIKTLVVFGLSHSEVFGLCDQHRKRTLADHMSVLGEKRVNTLASTTQACYYWDTFQTFDPNGRDQAHRILEYFESHADEMRAGAEYASQTRKQQAAIGLPGSIVGTSYVLFGRLDSDDRDTFLDAVLHGAELSQGHSALLLRNRILENRRKFTKLRKKAMFALVFKAWNYYRVGDTPKIMRWRPDEDFPIPE